MPDRDWGSYRAAARKRLKIALPWFAVFIVVYHYCPVNLKRFPRNALFSAAFREKLAGVDLN
jgi:hypothetical protein